jgi:ATP-binding cassette subfamily B protein
MLQGAISFVMSMRRAWRLVWQAGPWLTIASLALLVLQSALPLLALYLAKLIVDAITIGVTSQDAAVALHSVMRLIALAAGVTLISSWCNSLARVVGEVHAQLVTDHMHDVLHTKSIEVDLEYYENSQYYDTLHRAQQEGPYRPTRITKGLTTVCQTGLSLGMMATLLLLFHWGIAVILFATVVPEVFARLKYANKMYIWQRKRTSTERRAQYFDWMLTVSNYAQEIRLFDLGHLFMRRFRDLRDRLRQEKLQISVRCSATELTAQTSAILAVFGAYALLAHQAVRGIMTLGDLIMYFAAFQRGQDLLRQMLSSLASLYEDNLFLTNLYEFLDLKRKVVEPTHPMPVPRPMQAGIIFHRVYFRYTTGSRQVLSDINLTIPAGAMVALVGENGSGKTTLIKLLARLYDPTSGSITIDGINLRQFQTSALRREISVIFQDYMRYNLTARENIWFGNADLPSNAGRIAAAARQSGVDAVITGLPGGYDTVLGKWFEDGEELSVGEWQKVALARAFLREAQIFVLDEPTSAMDARAEYELFRRFHHLARGQTVILISHRLSAVRMADYIYVLEEGQIVESGNHDKLVHRNGTYARLFETQAQYYR